ncbi:MULTISPECIES: hypothetical protein [Dehalobacter]|uniref:hypothetical protein n=1 Tax=Dehalobacter TaxID=56112 RepID=UPI0025886CC4|nr:hypothetical protein [Dehalobacter sp.]MDJ0305886.1 hypothetical protein [Dehalobacter sp.]
MKKLIACFLTVILLIPVLSLSASASDTESTASNQNMTVVKDETVYADLKTDGSISGITVVNRIDTPVSGIYLDYGVYDSITNLSGSETPVLEGGKISWQLPARDKGFYYQGKLTKGELPFAFRITYRLNGQKVKPEDIIGKEGRIEITLKVQPNAEAKAYYRENYFCQVQLPLDLDENTVLSSSGASTMISGKTLTLAYMVLPQKNAQYTVVYDTEEFQMASMTMTCTCFDSSNFLNLNMDTGSITQMSRGAGQIVSGTEKLKAGLIELNKGIASIASGSAKLQQGAGTMRQGIEEYSAGASSLAAQFKQISGGTAQLSQQGQGLSAQYTSLSSGVTAMMNQLTPLLDSLPAEQRQAYLQQIGTMKAQLSQYGTGLSSYTTGVAQSAQGITEFSTGLDQFAQQGTELKSGSVSLANSSTALTSGLNQLASSAAVLPNQVQKLIDGQKQFKNGIDEASGLLETLSFGSGEETKPVSFVSSKISPKSVQFVIRTPDLKAAADEKSALTEPERLSFWERFINLFR